MTWNPRDSTIGQGKDLSETDGFRLPERPGPGAAPMSTTPYLPRSTPTVAEAMGWDDESDMVAAFPMDMNRELEYEGIVADPKIWDRWRTLLLRGYMT